MKDYSNSALATTLTQLGAVVTHENAASVMNLKRDARLNIEILDDAIRKGVSNFFDFSLRYRDNHLNRFIEDINLIEAFTGNADQKFVDQIRWSDDQQQVRDMRKIVSDAYLRVFNNDKLDRVVTDQDFWKCLDLGELRTELYLSEHFRSISSLFTREHAFDVVNKLLSLLGAIRLECMELSQSYENVFNTILDQLSRGNTIGNMERVRFNESDCVVFGNGLGAGIAKVINSKWYGRTIETTIGGLADDVKLLLSDPLEMCSPENSDNPKSVEYLFRFVQHDNVEDNLRILQREFITIVEQIDLSSKRLMRLTDRISDIPEDSKNEDMVADLFTLMEIYSRTLASLLNFVMQAAVMLEDSYQKANTLAEQVKALKAAIDGYVARRLK